MSLIKLALRIATVRALQGATWAQDRVYDSAISPIDERVTEERQPVVIVSTDADSAKVTGRSIAAAEPEIELTIETAVASRVITNDDATLVIPQTDAGMELCLDCMRRQIVRALQTSASPWAAVWRELVTKVKDLSSRRGASTEKGIQFAAHQIGLTCETIYEPQFGVPIDPESPWAHLLAAMRADPELAELAEIIAAEIEAPTVDAWHAATQYLGVNDVIGQMIGLGTPLAETFPQETPDDSIGTDWPDADTSYA